MRRLIGLLSGIALALAILMIAPAQFAWACTPIPGHMETDENGILVWVAGVTCPPARGEAGDPATGSDDDSPGDGGSAGDGQDSGGSGDSGNSTPEPLCKQAPAVPQPPASSIYWGGHKPSEGKVMQWWCKPPLTPETCNYCNVLTPTFYANGAGGGPAAPPPPPPPNREALAAQAMVNLKAKLRVTSLPMHFGPDAQHIAVNGWTWFWADDPGVLTATSPVDRGISVTVTARVTGVVWSPGEPVTCVVGQDVCDSAKVGSVTCDGVGSAPGLGVSASTRPDCGYMYKWRSSKGRTGGSGKWTVTATPTWDLQWQANGTGPGTGATAGGETQTGPASVTQVTVGEWRTRIVCTPGVDPDCSGS